MLQRNGSGSLKYTKMEATSGIKSFSNSYLKMLFFAYMTIKRFLGGEMCPLWTTMERRGQTSMQVGKI
jgi:hypothetical protein